MRSDLLADALGCRTCVAPAFLDSINHPAWLGEAPASGDDLQGLLHPFPAERMEAHAIAPRIGNVKNDDAVLIERVNSA